MSTVEKITTPDGQIPSVLKPVEGAHYTVVGGSLSTGDLVRVTCANGNEDFHRHTEIPGNVAQAKTLSWGDLALYLIGLLGGGATGRAALGQIISSCQAGTNADKFFAIHFQGQTMFTKAEFTAVLADVATAIVSNGQKTTVANNWPT